jgi:ribonuclease Z
LNPEIYILGCGSATPTRDRNPSSQVLKIGSEKIMIDCGEGTQSQLIKYGIRHTGMNYICISHLHGDHYFGLVGLISTMSLMGRKDTLHIIGPPPLKQILDLQILHGGMTLKFDIRFYPTNPARQEFVLRNESFELTSFPLKHRIHCTGFLIKESKKERHLNMDALQSYDIPVSFYKDIKKGESFVLPTGEIIENSSLTSDPDPCKSYAYCSDTIFDPEIVPYIQGVTMLYHESTYMKNNEERASLYFHSTAEQAATIAKMAKAGQLLIGHFSSRYDDLQPLLEEARDVFTHTELAEEGTKFVLESSESQVMIHS